MEYLDYLEYEHKRTGWHCLRAGIALKRLRRTEMSAFPSTTARLMNRYAKSRSLAKLEALSVFLKSPLVRDQYKFCPSCGKYFALMLNGEIVHNHAVRTILTKENA